jgi:hypothetical protein
MVNFYHHFFPICSKVLRPLTDLLRGSQKTLEWTVAAQEAFQNAKCLHAVAVSLQHNSLQAELSLATDTANSHIGGVMQQKSGHHRRPLSFFSRKFTDTESCYSTFDPKLLAADAAIRHFCHFCESQAFQFLTNTNHTPRVTALLLVTALSRVSVPISQVQQEDFAFISEFNVQILYLPGLKNVIVDFLSCSPTP